MVEDVSVYSESALATVRVQGRNREGLERVMR